MENTPLPTPLPQQIVGEIINAQTLALGILAAALGRHISPAQLKADIEAIHKDVSNPNDPNSVLAGFVKGMTEALTVPNPNRH